MHLSGVANAENPDGIDIRKLSAQITASVMASLSGHVAQATAAAVSAATATPTGKSPPASVGDGEKEEEGLVG